MLFCERFPLITGCQTLEDVARKLSLSGPKEEVKIKLGLALMAASQFLNNQRAAKLIIIPRISLAKIFPWIPFDP